MKSPQLRLPRRVRDCLCLPGWILVDILMNLFKKIHFFLLPRVMLVIDRAPVCNFVMWRRLGKARKFPLGSNFTRSERLPGPVSRVPLSSELRA